MIGGRRRDRRGRLFVLPDTTSHGLTLSVYVTQTLLQLLLFASPEARLAGRLSIALLPVLALALAILVTQRRVCSWWLARHAQGPVEWVWRRVTYGHGREIPAS